MPLADEKFCRSLASASCSFGRLGLCKMLFLLRNRCTVGYCFLRIRRLWVRLLLGAP